MRSEMDHKVKFRTLLVEPVRNGIYKQKEFHGRGCKIINMGELFGFPRLHDVPMKRVELTGKEQSKSLVQQGDLLFARRSLVAEGAGKCSIVSEVNEPTTFESSIIRARPNPALASSDYLYYFFSSPLGRERMATILRQMAVSGITGSDLMELEIECPELEHQKATASFLSALDDRIALLRETNITLESIALALFKSWFVDFDPVHARAEGAAPKGMDAATAGLFPDNFEESELGLVPWGWKVGTLADLANLNPESWTARNRPNSVAYIDLANAKDNLIAKITEYQFEDAPSRAKRVLRDGDTIVGTVRPGNRSFAFIANADANLTGSTGFAVLRPIHVEATEFIYLSATSDTSIEYLTHIADGGAYPAVRPEVVSSLKSILPDFNVLRVFHDTAAPIFKKIAGNHQQAEALTQLRDTLLPRLISGQLRLPEAESQIEAVFA